MVFVGVGFCKGAGEDIELIKRKQLFVVLPFVEGRKDVGASQKSEIVGRIFLLQVG